MLGENNVAIGLACARVITCKLVRALNGIVTFKVQNITLRCTHYDRTCHSFLLSSFYAN